ncbi:peptidase inhibitor family I36 protein [Rathayibacter sp. SD072]|uniref:peptidase inhibitor family I36 protein n=1 Tax=Rathayibacter sp. SD072 TaxID=2781731 RepID=UPI001A97C8A0|nr:peptidase inhibitor family I36 protein [Rathayibacter sp. SD072]MBO0985263.1 peptidase inhibitor family I36 protein [Rathayibacter sp. SD072]
MSSTRRASALVLAAVAVATLTAPVATAAESQCPTGFSCVWTDKDYSSSYSGRGNANYNEYYAVGGRIFNDSISSIKNRYPGKKNWFEHIDRGGARLEVAAFEKISNLQDRHTGLWYHADWNDFISSVD